jgi:hypothetical protein
MSVVLIGYHLDWILADQPHGQLGSHPASPAAEVVVLQRASYDDLLVNPVAASRVAAWVTTRW